MTDNNPKAGVTFKLPVIVDATTEPDWWIVRAADAQPIARCAWPNDADAIVAALNAPSAVSEGDAEDAARYRYLRSVPEPQVELIRRAFVWALNGAFDQTVDACMADSARAKEKQGG